MRARRRSDSCGLRTLTGITVLLGVLVNSGCSGGDAGTTPATSTTPAALVDDPAAVRERAGVVVRRLRTDAVRTTTTGVAGGQTIEIDAELDPAHASMRLDETLNGIIRTVLVMADDVLYANIYPLTEEEPPFTVTRPGDLVQDFLDQVVTASGRIFGDVEVLAAVIERSPAVVYGLGTRDGDAGAQTGLQFVFDAADVGQLLQDEGLERSVLLPQPGEDEIVIELWFDDRLRELRSTGSMYQDGELIEDVAVLITYEPSESTGVEIPTETRP